MFFSKFHKSNLITYIGVVFGVLSLLSALGDFSKSLKYSLIFLIMAGICDMFDGKFARMFKRSDEEKEIGIQLDSLADTFCFLAVPAAIALCNTPNYIFTTIVSAVFMLCGISRLAYFNVTCADSEKAIKKYQGLPVTSTSITFPIFGLIALIFKIKNLIWYTVILLITAILMIVKIQIPKFKGIIPYIIALLGIILIIVMMVI